MPQGLTNVIAIAAGFAHSLALRNDGTLVGWGGTITPAGLTNIVAIAATPSWDGNNLALRSDGTVIEWNTRAGRPSIVTGLSNVTSLVCGIGHQLALKSDGTVFGWGFNAGGEATGVATIDQPYRASGLVTKNGMVLSNVVSLAASETYNLALQANGTVVGWGNSGFKLAEVPAGLSNVVAIAAGGDYCLAVTTNSTVIERFRR